MNFHSLGLFHVKLPPQMFSSPPILNPEGLSCLWKRKGRGSTWDIAATLGWLPPEHRSMYPDKASWEESTSAAELHGHLVVPQRAQTLGWVTSREA